MSKQKIVIVGGGFAGLKAALILADSQMFDLTLITDHPDFRYYPTLYHTAAGGKKVMSSIPLAQIFKDKSITIVQDSVTSLDRADNSVKTKSQRSFAYDKLVLCLGVTTNFFGIKGLPEFSYGIKTNDEAERLKRHLHQQLIDEKHLDHNYVVVGGGPTGVELAGALSAYLRRIAKMHQIKKPKVHIDLVEATDRLVPRMPKDMSRAIKRHLKRLGVKIYLNTAVKAETADELMINGKRLSSHTVVWTAGVANHSFFTEQGFELAKNGRVRVSQYLEAEPDILVLGDNADTAYCGTAQTALYDGSFVANNLIRQASQKDPKPYSPKRPIYVLPIGEYWAAVLWGSVRIYGIAGWALRKLGDLVGYHDYQPWAKAGRLLLHDNEHEEPCPICGHL